MAELRAFWQAQAEWSQQTFGPDNVRGPAGPLRHLLKETQEALDNPSELEEYVDCQFLIFDAARRAGFTHDEFVKGCWDKLRKNKQRKWPAAQSLHEPVEHLK